MEVWTETIDAGRDSKAGFESSPFSSGVVALAFADGFPLTIQRSVVRRCAKLGLLLDSSVTIDLRRFSISAGHALVSYLYSGSYGQLKWTGPQNPTLDVGLVDLAAKLEIYALARTLELGGLEEQVRYHIERAARSLELFTVIDAIKETYPTPIGNDTWFHGWIKSLARKALRRPRRVLKVPVPDDFGDGASVVKFLFGSMLEVYIDILESQAAQEVGATGDDVHNDTPVTESSFEETDEFDDSRRANRTIASPGGTRGTEGLNNPITVPEVIAEPSVTEEECKLLRETLANRDRQIWWSALQVHLTQPPSHIGNRGPEASTKADSESEPVREAAECGSLCKEQALIVDEPKLEPDPEPQPHFGPTSEEDPVSVEPPREEDDNRGIAAKKKTKKKALKKKAMKPEPEPKSAPEREPASEPAPDEPAPEPEESQAVLELKPEPEPESTYTISDQTWLPAFKTQPRTGPLWGTWGQQEEKCESLEIGSTWATPSHEETGTVNRGTKKKKKSKKAGMKQTPSDVEEVPAKVAEPVPSMERLEGEMESPEVAEREPDPDPWVFWGVPKEKRSPSTSFAVVDFV